MKTVFAFFIGMSVAISAQADPPKNAQKHLPLPTGTVKLSDNFYADRYELSNLNYREYLAWLKRVHGAESETYRQALPDTLVWQRYLTYGQPFVEYYFDHPAYNDYPVVGISQAQAAQFAQWRSDRVYEQLLLRHKRIDSKVYSQQENSENYFSIERYRSGQFFGYVPDLSLPVPEYRLPTTEEWAQLAQGSAHDNDAKAVNHRDFEDGDGFITARVDAYKPNKYGLFNVLGNIAEMTAEQGIAKGGSYHHTLEQCTHSEEIPYTEPNAWLGVRFVCSWK